MRGTQSSGCRQESAPEVLEAPGADGALLGTASIEVDGANPWPGDDARGLLRDWVMPGASIGAPGSVATSDATPALDP
jgi:hypothetical protein